MIIDVPLVYCSSLWQRLHPHKLKLKNETKHSTPRRSQTFFAMMVSLVLRPVLCVERVWVHSGRSKLSFLRKPSLPGWLTSSCFFLVFSLSAFFVCYSLFYGVQVAFRPARHRCLEDFRRTVEKVTERLLSRQRSTGCFLSLFLLLSGGVFLRRHNNVLAFEISGPKHQHRGTVAQSC